MASGDGDPVSDERPADKLDHIVRPSLPWRQERITECGRAAGELPVITKDELVARVKRLGQQRTAFTVCMTCYERVRYSKTWDVAPEDVLSREINRRDPDELRRLRRELAAVTALVAKYQDEFDAMVTGLEGTPSLAAYRRAKRMGR